MKTLLTLTDEDIGLKTRPVNKWKTRRAVRCILTRPRDGKIALLYVTKHAHHKLPGGGVDAGETLAQALRRETREEVGSAIRIGKPVGKSVERKSRFGITQISTCVLATQTKKGKPHYTQRETEEGFRVEWHSLPHAIQLMTRQHPTNYHGKFVLKRDLRFLEEAQKQLAQTAKK